MHRFSLLLFIDSVLLIYCYTHWTATKNQQFIEPVADSPYHLKQPHSLVRLHQQERSYGIITRSRDKFAQQQSIIDEQEKADHPNIENEIRSSDPNCILAEKFVHGKDLLYITHPLHDIETILNAVIPTTDNTGNTVPFCATELLFSPYAFEHLKSMQNRNDLQMPAEKDLEELLSSYFDVKEFGRYAAVSLDLDPRNVSVLNFATIYWRLAGNATNAIECLRLALHYSSKSTRRYAELAYSLGYILFRAGSFVDAILLYQYSLFHLNETVIHVALGDAFTAVGNSKDAITEYEIARLSNPELKEAAIRAASLKCDLKLIDAMEKQHQNLLHSINEKHLYNDRLDHIKKIEQNLKENTMNCEGIEQSNLLYNYFKYGSLPHSTCRVVKRNGYLGTYCNVNDKRYFDIINNKKRRYNYSRYERNTESDMDTNFRLNGYKEGENFAKHPLVMDEPKYPLQMDDPMQTMVDIYLNRDWPAKHLCDGTASDLGFTANKTKSPQLFMNPVNKGFTVSDLLSKHIGIDIGAHHSLPWYLPYCNNYQIGNTSLDFFKLSGVKWAESLKSSYKLGEDKLYEVFINLVDGGATDADIAQRINTLLDLKNVLAEVALNLAALFWRINGSPRDAIICLRAALSSNVTKYSDIALTQLAQIVIHNAENELHFLDAESLIDAAIAINPNEPLSFFLRSVVSMLRKQPIATTIDQVKLAIALDPYFQPAISLLRSLRCSIERENFIINLLQPRCCLSWDDEVICAIRYNKPICFVQRENFVFEVVNCGLSHRIGEGQSKILRIGSSIALMLFSRYLQTKRRNSINDYSNIKRINWNVHQLVNDESDYGAISEIPLDYNGEASLLLIGNLTARSEYTLSQSKIEFDNVEVDMEALLNNGRSWTEVIEVGSQRMPKVLLSASAFPHRKLMLQFDIDLPEILPLPQDSLVRDGYRHLPLPKEHASSFCSGAKMSIQLLQDQIVSTWVSVTAKGINFEAYIDKKSEMSGPENRKPICPISKNQSPIITLDHLPAYHLHDQFVFYMPEKALADAFQSLGNGREGVDQVANRIVHAMEVSRGNSSDIHWILSTASTLYWRVKGDAKNAIRCLRHSLINSPTNVKDISFLSMSNIYYQAGFLHSALIASGSALGISPNLVAIHFTLANIYASMANYHYALQFYYSTLSLQSNFEPAKERIRIVYCNSGQSSSLRKLFDEY